MSVPASESTTPGVGGIVGDLEALYKDVHGHPELSMQEERTAGIAAERLRTAGFEVTTGIGKTGVVGLLENGDGPTVMLRADMDALPISGSKPCRTGGGFGTVGTPRDYEVAATTVSRFKPVQAASRRARRGRRRRAPRLPSRGSGGSPVRSGDCGWSAAPRAVRPPSPRGSGAPKPPEITPLDRYQLVRNDAGATERVRSAFRAHFGEERVVDIPPISASEDFGSFGSEWHAPSVFWTVGGTDAET
jgi:hypothetical protein